MADDWIRPLGSSQDPEYEVAIRPGDPGWSHTGLLVATLADGESRSIDTGDCEYVVLPLAGGGVDVECGSDSAQLTGRPDVFSGPTDCAYIPRDSSFTVTSRGGGKVAFPFAKAASQLPFAVVAAGEVPTELRGAGQCSRQVQNFGTPGTMDADAIIACEVITPAGNWSSYPPHKHDTYREGLESALEEIYYFEMRTEPARSTPGEPSGDGPHPPADRSDSGAASPATPRPVGYQVVNGTDERPIDVKAEVSTGDVVLVPHGWHGPSMTPPGYDMYYLNVMAGPGPGRVWLICDDPDHGWVRSTWAHQDVDARLPIHDR